MRRKVLRESANAGYKILKSKGGSAIDAVEEAIQVLEDSKVFNAGAGSCLTLEGKISTDASIMEGSLNCGSIGDANVVKNPISLARSVMEKSDHVLMVGSQSLEKFCHAIGFKTEQIKPTQQRLEQYRANLIKMKKGQIEAWPKNYKILRQYVGNLSKSTPEKFDTVGAVAVDHDSRVCSGVSTGGRWLKLPGRVGDSAIIGAGLYADNLSGAACATGAGEEIIRVNLCKTTCDLMRMGASAQSACEAAISMLTASRGEGTAGV